MQTIRAKQVLNYVFMPGIVPRLKEFFGTGTGTLAYLIAVVFQTARLLPPNHAYLNSANIRKYGIRDVFAEAGNNLVFDSKHLDQVLIFFTLMLGFVLLLLQFVMLIVGLIISQAHALPLGSLSPGSMFSTPDPTYDIAFELLDRVFGVPDIFNSCVAQGVSCLLNPSANATSSTAAFPTPFNTALHGLFEYYSMGLLVVGMIIFLYYILVVVAETAQTGTPFGKRFSHIWVPIRLVVAIGLLIPINYGLNTGQYIVLYAAKMGSGFATNGWNLYNASLENALGADSTSLYARPNPPDIWPMIKFMLVVNTCVDAYELEGVKDIKPYLVKSPLMNQEVSSSSSYKDALEFYNKGDVVIRFGAKADDSKGFVGGIQPYCGEILIPTQAATDHGSMVGPYQVQQYFFQLITFLWSAPPTLDFSEVSNHLTDSRSPCSDSHMASYGGISCKDGIGTDFISQFRSDEQSIFDSQIADAREAMITANGMTMTDGLLSHGWGGAGIWYNKIAEVNGAFFGAVNFVPTPTLMPIPVIAVLESRRATDQNINTQKLGAQNQSDGQAIKLADPIQQHVATAIYEAYARIGPDKNYQSNDSVNKGNVLIDAVNLLFGTSGLFTMRKNTDIHPLAQLVGLGKGIMDATIRNLFTATLFSAGGGFMSAFPEAGGIGKAFELMAGLFTSVASVSLTIGFTLYYVLPFLPFMYFFFAVGGWVKSIFEAMVGVPLWALGHLRIDGHGLPGEGALEGYYMIFEIFLRPILIVFGLIGGVITFTALAKVLNEIFTLVTTNLTGFDTSSCLSSSTDNCASSLPPKLLELKRNVIDQFFFTILYTVIIYMMATSSFKMIDQIPSRILRWLGTNASGFADHNDAEGVMNRYLVGGALNMTQGLTGAVTSTAGGAGATLGKALNPPAPPQAPPTPPTTTS